MDFIKKKRNFISRVSGSQSDYDVLSSYFPEEIDPLAFLAEKALYFAQRYLKKNEPFNFPEIPKQKVKGDDINLIVKIKNLSVASGGDFVIEDISTDPSRMGVRFKVYFPLVTIAGKYLVTGKEQGKKVSAKGFFRLGLYNTKATGRISLLIIEGKIYVKRLDVDYIINHNLKVEEITLDGTGMTEDDLFELLPHVMFLYLDENEKIICYVLSVRISEYANIKLSSRSVRGALKWLIEG